ncbi:MAG: cytochrome P450, partial [Solirubrobacterales bacterium]|nr:cytochrome P450 [Solirubrobacterales bacterium]
PAQWSSDPRTSPALVQALGETVAELWSRSLLMSDPPTHARLRGAVKRFFTPRAVQRIETRVRAIVDAAVAPLADGAPVELMNEVAYPIPLGVIAELFNIGEEGAQLLQRETPALIGILEVTPSSSTLKAAMTAAMTLTLFLIPILAERRRRPGEDLLSALVDAPGGQQPLEPDEIIGLCLLLLAAGHETTANLIGNGSLALLEHPDQLDALDRNPELTRPAVEEMLRYDAPTQVVSRIAREDHRLGSIQISAGRQALIVVGAANRDPLRHAQPDQLTLRRADQAHLAFGHGPHFCLGAALARVEAQAAFSRICGPLSRFRRAGWSGRRGDTATMRRLQSLWVGTSSPPGARALTWVCSS